MKYLLFLFTTLTLYNCSPKVIHNTEVIDDNKQSALQEKFSNLLNVPTDSIYNLRLYKNLESWNTMKDSLNFQSISHSVLFINYIYYKHYHIALPYTYDEIIKSKKVYLYRNTNYLREGDLVFFQEKDNPEKSIGIYLKNKHFTSASLTGELKYYEIKDTISNIKILSNAKLYN